MNDESEGWGAPCGCSDGFDSSATEDTGDAELEQPGDAVDRFGPERCRNGFVLNHRCTQMHADEHDWVPRIWA